MILMLIALIIACADLALSVATKDTVREVLDFTLVILIMIEVGLKLDDWLNLKHEEKLTVKKNWFNEK